MKGKYLGAVAVSALLVSGLVAGCTAAYETAAEAQDVPEVEAVAEEAVKPDPSSRRAFFGEMHLHTGYSFDAYALMGSRAEPENAWRFARGEVVTYLGDTVQRSRPLDFMALTDHSEFLGASLRGLRDPDTPFAQSRAGKLMLKDPLGAALGQIIGALAGDENSRVQMANVMADAWSHEVGLANKYNEPGKFTAFAAYEWTTMLESKYNLHRNVIFRDKAADRPFSAADSNRPEDLWAYLDRQRAQGIEGLAIPHNSNASGGLMFDWRDSDGNPIDEAYAQARAMNEPLVEIYQHKGQSETSPVLSPDDEFADFERAESLLTFGKSDVNGSFARQGLGRGLVIEKKVGANPFAYGFVASSDFHNGLSDSAESSYAGNGLNSTDPKVNLPDREFASLILGQKMQGGDGPPNLSHGRLATPEKLRRTPGLLNWSGAGLTGVWAEENTRDAIYAALRRKETFATSGTMMRMRIFGGWNLLKLDVGNPGWVKLAYRQGVPMGGDLPVMGQGATAPQFLFEAAKDPEGANLDRIQIVKIWLDGDTYGEKVFDVAWSAERSPDEKTGRIPPVKNTVDLKTAKYENSVGAAILRGRWQDPEFEAGVPAVYYARVLEIPTPRWPTLLAAAHGLPLPDGVPPTFQERAISSPIWYRPQSSRN